MTALSRAAILPEPDLPDPAELIAEGRRLAQSVSVEPGPFLDTFGVESEHEFKQRRMADGGLMFHAQVGYRDPEKTRRAFGEIHQRVAVAGYAVDRYGICLDWSMGYPSDARRDMPKGTGLILDSPEAFTRLTRAAPVAPHFGDWVIGTPAAVENTSAALLAGSTSIGNLGQYFTFRLPRWDDDVGTTAETVKAIALCAAQPVEVLIHSNLDDGFAAMFTDLACGIGAVLIEQVIVDELLGGRVSHCYGHVFSDPLTRLGFQRALAKVSDSPGTMVYGNTTIYGTGEVENYANLSSYLLVDLVGQRTMATGHALNPVPVSEALRIPEIHEIVDAHLFANRLAERTDGFERLFDFEAVNAVADRLVEGGRRFKARVFEGLTEAGIEVSDPFELLLAIRRIGPRRMEELWGPGYPDEEALRGRVPLVAATTVAAVEAQSGGVVAALDPSDRDLLRQAGLSACVASTDVHEYGKLLVVGVLDHLGVRIVDTGVSSDPEEVAATAADHAVDFIALSTYSGIALSFVEALAREMAAKGVTVPVFVGGKLNQIPEDTDSSMPVDVTDDLGRLGVMGCQSVEDMLGELVRMVSEDHQG